MTAQVELINVWTQRDKLYGSRRDGGKLLIKELNPVTYPAFCRSNAVLDKADYVIRLPDFFDGWNRVDFRDYDGRVRALEKYGELLYEADISPVRRYLADRDVVIVPPRRCFLDIETDSRVPPRVQAEEAPGRILSWAIVDQEGGRWVETLEDDEDDSETDLLEHLWSRMAEYDQVCAWSGDSFDFPVIDLRSQRLLRKSNLYWDNKRRLLFLDHLLCFKRHHMAPESGDDKTSMKLNSVCQAILGEGKHDFDARKTWDAWFEGGEERARMTRYNLQDTELLAKLEAATGYLELQQAVAKATHTPANTRGMSPVTYTDGYMARLARVRKTHLPSKKPPTGNEEQYAGAFVLEPQALGVHRTVHVCDFRSLYPTVIRSFNISPDTKGELGGTALGTGVSFGMDEEGMVPIACRELMGERDAWKKKAKADPNDKHAERMNKAFKIVCNTIYGVLGTPWSRYFDREIAESVTLGARALLEATMAEAKRLVLTVLYGDTDSVFITGCTVEEFKAFVDHCNANVYPKMLSAQGCDPKFYCIELDYEKCFDRLVFPLGKDGKGSSKRYAGSYLHYAFKPKTKPEIRGLEYMRGDGLRLARHLQKDAIDRILAGQTFEQLEEWVQAQRQRVMTEKLPIEEILISKGLGQDLGDYKNEPPHVRLAREQEAAGEDVGQGSKISYVITNGRVSPMKIIAAENYTGEFDRHYIWMKCVYPCLLRVLGGAFQDRNWARWIGKWPKPILSGQMGLGLT